MAKKTGVDKDKDKKTAKLSDKSAKSFYKSRKFLTFVGIFALVGGAIYFVANSAGFQANIEPENASLTTGASVVTTDSSASGGRYVQFGTTGTNPPPTACADGPNFTSANICINPASIQPAEESYSTQRIESVSYRKICVSVTGGVNCPDGSGGSRDNAAMRTDCGFSHLTRNDPIVYPNQPNAAHWHVFTGNTAMDDFVANPANEGASTCAGGSLNRTGYWAPALIDTNSYNPTTKQFNVPRFQTDHDPGKGEYEDGNGMQVYYKAGYRGVLARDLEWFPAGLKMIAGGNPNQEPTAAPNNNQVWFDCISTANTQSIVNGLYHLDRVPANCPPGMYIQANIEFPQCGRNNPDGSPMLDSPNHRDHMAYAIPGSGCPSSHPRAYPQITEHFRWQVPAGGASGMRFSSDMWPNRPAGWTFHADWYNGWNVSTGQGLIDNCYHGGLYGHGWDCQVNLLGTTASGGGYNALGY